MMPENNWYGHTFVLARYCTMDARCPAIWGSLHHGWAPEYDFDVGTLRRLPRLVWNQQQADAARAAGQPEVGVIGAPFLYASASILGADHVLPRGVGTLLMPRHSTPGQRLTEDHRVLIDEVEATEEPPFTAALYHLDLERDEVRRSYEDAGWRIVTFGDRAQDLFLYRVLAEMARHGAVVSNGISTALFYGAHLGRRIRVLESAPDPAVRGRLDTAVTNAARWPGVYGLGIEGDEAAALARVELGGAALLGPEELRVRLGWTSWRRPAAGLGRLGVDVRVGRGLRRGEERAGAGA